MKKYKTILIDPPWPYGDANGKSHTLQIKDKNRKRLDGSKATQVNHLGYGTLTIDELKSLPIQKLSAPNAHLYLWTTNAFMEEAHILARTWGFKPKTILTWVKTKKDLTPSMKTGYYYRGATEHVLFCVRGSLRLKGRASPTAYYSPREPHSRKPDLFHNLIEQQSHVPRLEMFARETRIGWDVWGDQIKPTPTVQKLINKLWKKAKVGE